MCGGDYVDEMMRMADPDELRRMFAAFEPEAEPEPAISLEDLAAQLDAERSYSPPAVPRPVLHNPEVAQARVDGIVARAAQSIASEQRRLATLGSRKPSRREKRARR